jgi:hypothetical protein
MARQTVWCAECDGPVDVVEEGRQTDTHGIEWWVTLFDCGHEAAVQ